MTIEEITAMHVIGIMLLVLLIAIIGFICYLMGRYTWKTKYEPTTIIREVPIWTYTRTDIVKEPYVEDPYKPHHNYPHLLVG